LPFAGGLFSDMPPSSSTPPFLVPEHDDFVLIAGQPFCESEYLEMNPDVRAAVEAGLVSSGRQHFEMHGLAEGRLGIAPFGIHAERFFGEQPVDVDSLGELKADKFPYAGPHPWLDQPDWEQRVHERVARGELTEAEAQRCRDWVHDGYIVIENCIASDVLDGAWAAYERAIAEGRIKLEPEKVAPDDPYPGRYLDPHLKVPEMCHILRDPEVLRWVKVLMDREPAPFQTITSHKGSQQGAHSDSIHMTTYPLGYLTASWVAFEDIHPDCGPLVYYPGSHKLPYVFSKDVGIDASEFSRSGYKLYQEKYEPWIKRVVEEQKLEPHYFHAKKGDVLIWHANLIHGGSPRRNLQLSRKAVVCHYFVRGAVTYHDLSGQKARGHTGTCLLRRQTD
jgi:hypothetical protein